MENKKYKIIETNSDSDWDNFLRKTENQNIYSSSDMINSSNFDPKRYFIKKKDEIFASFHLLFNRKKIDLGDRIYTPLNFKIFEKQNSASIKYKKFEIIETYANFLYNNFKEGNICFDYSTADLRPFYWINFNMKKQAFSTKFVKYTSILNLKEFSDFTDYSEITSNNFFKNFSRSLKQQISKSVDEQFSFKEEFDFDFFKNTFEKNLSKQKSKIDINFSSLKKVYENLYNKKNLYMFLSLKNNRKTSFCIFGVIGKKAIYLNGGRILNSNDDNSLTHNLLMSLSILKKRGVETLDLEGVNSPKRGFWKLAFGGEIKPYYHLSFKF